MARLCSDSIVLTSNRAHNSLCSRGLRAARLRWRGRALARFALPCRYFETPGAALGRDNERLDDQLLCRSFSFHCFSDVVLARADASIFLGWNGGRRRFWFTRSGVHPVGS